MATGKESILSCNQVASSGVVFLNDVVRVPYTNLYNTYGGRVSGKMYIELPAGTLAFS